MAKPFFAIALLTGAFLSSAHAADGTINFTGTILDAGCTIDAADATQTVNLGSISKTSFASVGSVAGASRFQIRLSGCPAAATASARFDGALNSVDSRLLDVTGGASGVGIAIYETDGATIIPMSTESQPVTIDAATQTGKFEFVAKYMSTALPAAIVSGGANSVVQYTISYN